MDTLLRRIQSEYQYTDFEIAQIRYGVQIVLSESSKLLFLFLFFGMIGKSLELLITLAVLFPLRITCGGIHCKHYWSCFSITFFFIMLCIALPQWGYPGTTTAMAVLFICMLLHYHYAPITSIFRPELTHKKIYESKLKSFGYILIDSSVVFLIEMNPYAAVVFWTIVLQTAQLIIAYYLRKDDKNVD